jgi:thiamine biosynthesis protein ThiC
MLPAFNYILTIIPLSKRLSKTQKVSDVRKKERMFRVFNHGREEGVPFCSVHALLLEESLLTFYFI